METPFATSPAPAPGQSPFYYYNPDPDPQHRQHGHFTPHPADHQAYGPPILPYQSVQPTSVPQPGMIVQSHHMQCQPSLQPNVTYSPGISMTPIASPRPSAIKPTIVVQHGSPALIPLDTSFVYNFPATPPLSSSGSAGSSPPSTCGLLPTPIHGTFLYPEGVEGVKEGCEGDVNSEILAAEWAQSGSPPMTPGMAIIFLKI